MHKIIFQAVLGLSVLAGGAFAGPVSISYVDSTVSGMAGATVTLVASMTNSSGVTQNLNGDQFSLSGTPFVLSDIDDSDFFDNWPLSLAASESFGPQALFDLTIPLGTAPGLYSGTFILVGGPGANDQNNLGSGDFQINVNAPEPGTLGLFGLAITAVGLAVRRNVRS